MQRVAGEWRISAPPEGLVLARGDIDRGFRAFDLYYFNHDFSVLAPAPIVIPVSESGLATQLVRSLLAGPTDWLAPAVRTAFPEGTRLNLESVPVTDSTAWVDLSAEALSADDATRQALSAQLSWTLRQLPEIGGVRITVLGQPFLVAGAGTVQPLDSWSAYDPDGLPSAALAYAVDKKGLVQIGRDGTLTSSGRLRPALGLPAVGLDSARLAGITEDSASVWESRLPVEQPAVKRYAGASMARPSYDRDGGLWIVDRGKGLVLLRNASVLPMPVDGLPRGVRDADIRAVSVSRDGTRLAMLVRRGSFVEPMVARIERSADTVRVSAPRRIEAVITDALDLAWLDGSTLAILGAANASSLEVLQLGVGTFSMRRTSAPQGATEIAAAPGNRPILVGAGGILYRQSGASWVKVADGADPVYPG
jgi:hypothetical protein